MIGSLIILLPGEDYNERFRLISEGFVWHNPDLKSWKSSKFSQRPFGIADNKCCRNLWKCHLHWARQNQITELYEEQIKWRINSINSKSKQSSPNNMKQILKCIKQSDQAFLYIVFERLVCPKFVNKNKTDVTKKNSVLLLLSKKF